MSDWTTNDIPDQTGRLVLITGATGGLGYETALALAGKNATVVLTGRSDAKGAAALAKIRSKYPSSDISYETLDLSSLKFVAAFAQRFSATHDHLDNLVKNAGVMMPPQRQTTLDGFELQFGTNYLSHFALTAQLLPLLRRGSAPRIVNLSSGAHNSGAINFDNLQAENSYGPWKFYAQSKLAMLMFALELQRHSDANGWGLMSNAAHPGFARTDLITNGPGAGSFMSRVSKVIQPLISQSGAEGTLPQLYAATDAHAENGAYYGPTGLFEMKGPVGKARVAKQASDTAVAAQLWRISEQLTGVKFPERQLAA